MFIVLSSCLLSSIDKIHKKLELCFQSNGNMKKNQKGSQRSLYLP